MDNQLICVKWQLSGKTMVGRHSYIPIIYIYVCQMSFFCVTRDARSSCNMRLNFTHKNRILCNGHENYVKVLFQFIFIYYNVLVWKIRLNQSWFVCIHKRNDKKLLFFFFSCRCEGYTVLLKGKIGSLTI